MGKLVPAAVQTALRAMVEAGMESRHLHISAERALNKLQAATKDNRPLYCCLQLPTASWINTKFNS